MISRDELKNRIYRDRECVEFTYELYVTDKFFIPIKFTRIGDDLWDVFVYITVPNSFRYVLYDGAIKQYSRNMTLEEVCAQGIVTVLRASTDMAKLFQDISYSSSKIVGDIPGMQ